MKIIHCADLHLDSKLNANLEKEQIRERRGEILHTFVRMVEYAKEHDIYTIMIAGDMFDTKNISATARNTVLHNIINHSQIQFYYLRGNHDKDNFLTGLDEIPENLKMFGSQWTTYRNGDIVITGVELDDSNKDSVYNSLVLDAKDFNIVMLHGQEVESASKDKAEVIRLKELRNRGIDYLALGHIHGYKKETLDPRGIYCYPGCLEGRGFDECGEHGFVVIEVDEETHDFSHEFVPFAQRKLYTVVVDVSECETTDEMVDRTRQAILQEGCESNSLVKIVLTGMLDVECEKDTVYLLSRFKKDFYFVKVYDETTLKINIEDYLLDESLKGEYVRMVMNDKDLSEEEKAIVVRYGLQAIAGEEVQ